MVRRHFTGAASRCLAMSALALWLCSSPVLAKGADSLRQTPAAYEAAYPSMPTSYLDPAPEATKADAPKDNAPKAAAVEPSAGDHGVWCPPRRFFYADFEATFLSPEFRHQSLSIEGMDWINDEHSWFYPGAAVEDSMYVGPRMTLGVQGECWGLAGRFWQLRGSEAGSEIGDWCNTSTYQHFNAFTTDLELTRQFCAGCWQGQLAFGVRHAEVDLDTCLRAEQYFEAVDPDDDSAISGLANAISRFHGTGLTFGLWTKRPISSRVYLFGGLRGSVLWGEAANGGAATAAYANSDGFEHDAYLDVCVRDETMFIGEVQVGLQYECPLRCLPANAFFRVAFEYQNWSVSSPSNQVVAYREELNVIGVESIVTSSDVDMQLVGFNLGAGITW